MAGATRRSKCREAAILISAKLSHNFLQRFANLRHTFYLYHKNRVWTNQDKPMMLSKETRLRLITQFVCPTPAGHDGPQLSALSRGRLRPKEDD